jgi:hypothetical protein
MTAQYPHRPGGLTSRQGYSSGVKIWTMHCDHCDHRFTIAAVDTHAEAERVAVSHGWDVSVPRTLCPACASAQSRPASG